MCKKIKLKLKHKNLSDVACLAITEKLYCIVWFFSDQREVRKQQSAIFKWETDKFILYQSLYTLGAQAWEHFTIGSNVSCIRVFPWLQKVDHLIRFGEMLVPLRKNSNVKANHWCIEC